MIHLLAPWTRHETKERFPDSISPLGWSVLQSALKVNLASIKYEFNLKKIDPDQIARWVDGYLYSNKRFFKKIPFYHFSIQKIGSLIARLISTFWFALRSPSKNESLKVRFLKRIYATEIQGKIEIVLTSWASELPIHIDGFEKNAELANDWSPFDPDFHLLMNKIESDGCAFNRLDFAIFFYKNILKFIIESLNRHHHLKVSIEHLSSQSDFQISKHLQHVLSQDALRGRSFVMSKIGHLSLSWDIAQPTFSEQPVLVEKMVFQERQRPSSTEATDLFSHPPQLMTSELFEQFTKLISCDEEHRFYASYQFPTVRKILYKIANVWNSGQCLPNIEDIFYLTLEEVFVFHKQVLQKDLSVKENISSTIENRKQYIKKSPPDALFQFQIKKIESLFYTSGGLKKNVSAKADGPWTGQVVSQGKICAPVFWVTSYESLTQCPANVIILCETPSPNFHSAFLNAKGIVSETGGLLSHGAIIARELKIPCLLQVKDLKSLKNGDWIELNTELGQMKRTK